jgi:hypothetical protein
MEHDDEAERDEEESPCPAPVPPDEDHQEKTHPNERRQDERFEKLFENKHQLDARNDTAGGCSI